MVQSAIERASRRRLDTARRISLRAQELTDERGLDGFTMDDLAAAADVSRRTLFNYFPGKVDAVLGPWSDLGTASLAEDDPRTPLVAAFRAGGPDGDLVRDLRTLVLAVLDVDAYDREEIQRSRRILRESPRLMAAVHERYLAISGAIVEHVVVREGAAFAAARAQIAVALIACLLDSSLDAFLDDEQGRDLTHHLDQSLATARSLLGG